MTEYAFGDESRQRLAGIEVTWDSKTIRHLEELGVGPGWKCLEVGAGGGTIAEWLARRVDPGGRVLAVDLDTRFVERIDLPNLEARALDIRTGDLPQEAFDLLHARLLLSHVHKTDALDRMLATLKPGGVILLEEFDFTRARVIPASPLAERTYGAMLDQLELAGWDRSFGNELYGLLTAAGLEGVRAEGGFFFIPCASPESAFESGSLTALREGIQARGALTSEEVDEALTIFDDPANAVISGVMIAAWGRKATAA